MRSVALVLAGLLVVAGVSAGQAQGINLLGPDKRVDPDAEAKRIEAERAYRAATKNIPDQKAADDPWGNVRNGPQAKTTPTKPRPKP
jgi:hypothetical protein